METLDDIKALAAVVLDGELEDTEAEDRVLAQAALDFATLAPHLDELARCNAMVNVDALAAVYKIIRTRRQIESTS